jgi:broad-specificity NMP kinase
MPIPMPIDGPLHICDDCGELSDPSLLDEVARTLTCRSCGASVPYRLSPPLLFLTGPSGAGKTTVYRHLSGHVAEAVLIDQDLLWGVDPTFDDPSTEYRRFRTLVFAMGLRIARNGRPVVIEGTTLPKQYESLPARPLVSSTAYLALVCDDDELVARLQARPAWRRSSTPEFIEGMLRLNRAYKAEGRTWSPPVELLDTTGRTVEETAADVHAWIRRSIAAT